MKERITKIHPRQQESEDYNYSNDDNIEHYEVQSPQKIRVHQSSIEDEKPSKLELRTPEPQLKRSKRVRKPNLSYTYGVIAEEDEIKELDMFK